MKLYNIRRKHLALVATICMFFLTVLTYFCRSSSNQFLGPAHWYIAFPVFIFNGLFTIMLYIAKKGETKSFLTIMTWIFLIIYFVFFIYYISVDPNAFVP